MAEIKFEESFIENSPTTRAVIRKYIIRHNLIPYVCEKCGNDGNWQGQLLTLQLDHKNGINNDHRLENLRWLCPNCHSQTETFTGRNKTDKEKIIFTEEQAVEALKNTPNVHQATKYIGCAEGGANWIRLKAIKNKFNIIQEDDISKPTLIEAWVRASKKEPKIDVCQKCGKVIKIDTKTKMCRDCYNLYFNRKVENRPSREELKELLRKESFIYIGHKYGVSDNAIRKWCDAYNLPRKKRDIKQYTDEEWENI